MLLAFRNMDTRVYCHQEPSEARWESVSWGLFVSSCVLWEMGHNRLRYLCWVSKTTKREYTYKPLSLREGVSPPSAGSSLGDVESRTPWAVGLSRVSDLGEGSSSPENLQGMSWSLCLEGRGSQKLHWPQLIKGKRGPAVGRGSCPGTHSPHQGFNPILRNL